MTDKEAIDNLKNYIECLMGDYGYYKDIVEFRDSVEHLEKSLQTQQAEIEKKNKIIDETIRFLTTRTWATCPNEDCGANLDCENRCSNDDNIYEECWKMYFERKVKNGN